MRVLACRKMRSMIRDLFVCVTDTKEDEDLRDGPVQFFVPPLCLLPVLFVRSICRKKMFIASSVNVSCLFLLKFHYGTPANMHGIKCNLILGKRQVLLVPRLSLPTTITQSIKSHMFQFKFQKIAFIITTA